MKKFLFVLFCLLNINFVHAATEMTDVYLLAQTKNITELQNIENIDIVDTYGNTALCSAIKDGNVKAYNLLKNAGANEEHECVKKIPIEQYEHFITKVASADKSWSFLGLGKWAWATIGVGAVGVAAGVAASGGSSDGGSSNNTNSVDANSNNNNYNSNDNTENNNQQNQSCESQGYTYSYTDVCPDGWQKGSSCTNGTNTKYKCDQLASCPSNYTASCPSGYTATENTCKSGDITYHECELIQLNCVNGVQNGTQCACNNGWTGTLCNEPVICPYQTTSCTGMYQETGNTCKSGEILYKECEPTQCGAHGIWSEQGCICNEGWTGTLCNIIIACPYDTTSCTGGYEETGNMCQSGETLYKECQQKNCTANASWSESGCFCNEGYVGDGYTSCETNPCPYNTTSCAEGFHETGQTCQFGQITYKECAENTCNGYNHTSSSTCPTGYTIGSSCQAGNIIKYKCDALTTCPYTTTSCTAGYEETGNTCQSGTTWYKECRAKTCPYQTLSCNPGYHESGNTCQSGETTYKECVINTCSYTTTSCVGGYVETGNTCQSGEILYKECQRKICPTGEYWAPGGCVTNQSDGIVNNGVYYLDNSNSNEGYAFRLNYGSNYSTKFTNAETGTIIINQVNNVDSVTGVWAGKSCTVKNFGTMSFNNNNVANGIHIHGERYYPSQVTNAETGTISISNSGGYGIFAEDYSRANNFGNISINNGSGAYGIVASGLGSSAINEESGHITITNSVVSYGIKADNGWEQVKNSGNIFLDNNFFAYGICSEYGSTATDEDLYVTNETLGIITIQNTTNANGIYAYGTEYSRLGTTTVNNFGMIHIDNTNIENSNPSGIVAENKKNSINNTGSIFIDSINGTAIGIKIFSTSSLANNTINNSGTINITTNGTAYGIYANNTSNIINSGTINITTNGTAYGIYANTGNITNTGIINITTDGTAYGIYAPGSSTIVRNTGTISINGSSCTGNACSNNDRYIYLANGATFVNSGVVQANALNLNSMGGNVVAGTNSQFIVENELSGDLNISSDIVQDGNQTQYTAHNMIDAEDISALNVRSASAMFDASIADNGHDVVMTMRDFGELTDNSSLAAFLAHNYANGNGTELFSTLKSMDNMTAFDGALSGLTGLNTFTQFAHEDLSAMREISFSMNNKLFENSGRDSFDISDSMGYFSFSNDRNGGSGQYGITSDRVSENWKLGYGMAMANINTNDGDGVSRQNKMWLFYMPATYENDGYELVIAPKAGFAHSEYSRRGYNNINYEGYIEKRIFGLMNDLRYPLSFGNLTIAPDFAFNTIVYTQSGHEDEQAFSLVIPDDRTVSIETGFGLYGKYEKTLLNGGLLKFTSGIMGYREFGDSYDIKLGMRGMDGTFNLYNNDYEYRGAASLGFDYTSGRLHLYGNAQYFMDNDNYMNFKSGVSYRF